MLINSICLFHDYFKLIKTTKEENKYDSYRNTLFYLSYSST